MPAADAAMLYLEAPDATAIVIIFPVSGREVDFAASPYGAMKVALINYVHGLARQRAAGGIRANAASPGNTAGATERRIGREHPSRYAAALPRHRAPRLPPQAGAPYLLGMSLG